jgi:hypothetical protein
MHRQAGDHQLAGVAQRLKIARLLRQDVVSVVIWQQRQENKQVYTHCHCPDKLVHHFLAVHKEQRESHKSQHLCSRIFIQNSSPTNKQHCKPSKLSRKAILAQRQINKQQPANTKQHQPAERSYETT